MYINNNERTNMKIQVISYQLIKDIIKEYKKLLLVLMGVIFVIFLLLAF